jgi:hypothetical protein
MAGHGEEAPEAEERRVKSDGEEEEPRPHDPPLWVRPFMALASIGVAAFLLIAGFFLFFLILALVGFHG